MENLPSYYTDFSLETISTVLGVSVETADVFPALSPVPVPFAAGTGSRGEVPIPV